MRLHENGGPFVGVGNIGVAGKSDTFQIKRGGENQEAFGPGETFELDVGCFANNTVGAVGSNQVAGAHLLCCVARFDLYRDSLVILGKPNTFVAE